MSKLEGRRRVQVRKYKDAPTTVDIRLWNTRPKNGVTGRATPKGLFAFFYCRIIWKQLLLQNYSSLYTLFQFFSTILFLQEWNWQLRNSKN
jgi:hypothetical protein